jgi:uncharacterized protein
MKTNQRRDFLKKSILGISGAALFPASLKTASNAGIQVKNELPSRTLGNTGLKIPVLSMGTGDTNNPALVQAVMENGVRLFGTSTYYGNGNNEAMLGGILKTMPRDSFLVATSAMPQGTDHQNGLFTDAEAGKTFRSDIEGSMKRLNVDYLDILFLPFAAKRESVFFEPLLRVMEDFKKQGKARFIGIATHSYVDQAIRAAADTKIYDVVMAAYNFNLGKNLQAVNDAVAYGASAGLGMIAMKTMAGGYWDKARTQPISSRAALKWVLQNENIHTMMSGMTNFEELKSNLAWLTDTKLNDEDRKELKLAQAGNTGLYCLQCRECDGKCIGNIDIPTIMRSYMYAYGYRNIQHARQTLDYTSLTSDACGQCSECTVNCKAGFDIRGKIRDIARLKDVPVEFI